MKSVGLFHGGIKNQKGQEGIPMGHVDHPSAPRQGPRVPMAPVAHPSSLSWHLIDLTVREDLL